jgi:hypothetical protein
MELENWFAWSQDLAKYDEYLPLKNIRSETCNFVTMSIITTIFDLWMTTVCWKAATPVWYYCTVLTGGERMECRYLEQTVDRLTRCRFERVLTYSANLLCIQCRSIVKGCLQSRKPSQSLLSTCRIQHSTQSRKRTRTLRGPDRVTCPLTLLLKPTKQHSLICHSNFRTWAGRYKLGMAILHINCADWVSWSKGNSLSLHSGGTWFKFQLVHWLCTEWTLGVFSATADKYWDTGIK